MQVLLQFAIDDTAGGENEDALTEIGFFVPKEAASFQDGQEHPAKVWIGSLIPMQDRAMQVPQNCTIIYVLSMYQAAAASCTGWNPFLTLAGAALCAGAARHDLATH